MLFHDSTGYACLDLVGGQQSSINSRTAKVLHQHESQGLGVSVISCWEVAKLVEVGRLAFSYPVQEWIEQALDYPGIQLLELTPRIAVESTQLPGTFHRDPADQIIVATARVLSLPLFSFDEKIDKYPHVNHVSV